MTIPCMQVLVDGDALGVEALKSGQEMPSSTLNMKTSKPLQAYISLNDLYDDKKREWVLAQLIPVVRPQTPGFDPMQASADTIFDNSAPVKKAIRVYKGLREQYRETERLSPKTVHDYVSQFESQFKNLPFWLKVAAYGNINANIIYPPDTEGNPAAEGCRAIAVPGQRRIRFNCSIFKQHLPFTLAEELIHGLDGNILFSRDQGFQGEQRDQEYFSDLSYWRQAVDKDLKANQRNPELQERVKQYLAITGKANSIFQSSSDDPNFYKEALADFARMEMMARLESGEVREPGASREIRRRMTEDFEHMATVFYSYPQIETAGLTVLKKFPDGNLRIGMYAGEDEKSGKYKVLHTFKDMCLDAARDQRWQVEMSLRLIRPQDRRSPEYQEFSRAISPRSADYQTEIAKQILSGTWGREIN